MNFGKLFAYLSRQDMLTNKKEVAVGSPTSEAGGTEPVPTLDTGTRA